ncbi:MAG TPA: kelch repeat-containing protein [Thermoplasmata archaeon]|nr:kelch repeat-containing protein [Thermoplasmata archaeon]
MHAKAILVAALVLSLLLGSVWGMGATAEPARARDSLPRGLGAGLGITAPTTGSSSWTLLGTHSPPRDGHAFVYDSKADRFILFGGAITTSGFTNSTWSYGYATNTWTNITPVVGPTARAGLGMVYDSKADRVILFGGYAGAAGFSNETWIFDPTNDTWSRRIPPTSPTSRVWPAMAYDSRADRTILFGGYGLSPLSDTWAYDYAANTWTRLNVSSPNTSYLASLAYDPAAGRDLLFGGFTSVAMPIPEHNTYALDYVNLTWTDLSPVVHPSGRGGSGFAFDTVSDRVVLFGGSNTFGGLPGNALNDTWAYDYGQNAWANVTPVVAPSPRFMPAMDFSPAANRTVLFGGATLAAVPYNDTWAFQYAPALPGAPQNLGAAAGLGRVTLTWQAPLSDGGSRVTSYTVFRGTTSGGETLLTTVGNVLTYTDTTGTVGTLYYYEVAAVTTAGEGSRSNEASAAPLPLATPPSAPQNPSATPGDAQVVLTWQAPSSNGGAPITNYTVYRGTTSGGELLLKLLGNVLAYTDTGLTNGQTYYYEIRANNSAGQGPASAEVSTTPETTPSAPQSLVATAGVQAVTLTWQAPVSDGGAAVSRYVIYRGTASGAETLLASTRGTALSYADSGLTSGTTYYYEVSALNAAGEGARSSEVHATPTAPPDTTPPSVAIASPINDSVLTGTSVTVTGSATDDVAVAKVELSTDGTTWILASGTTSWSGTVTLASGANTIYVRATDTSGNVKIVSVRVTVQLPSPAPQGLDPVLVGGIIVIVGIAAAAVAFLVWRRRKKVVPPPGPSRPGT